MIYGAKHMKVIAILTIFYIVFFLVSLCRVITKKETDEKNKDNVLAELDEFDKLCIKLWGKPFDELSKEDRETANFIATFN